MSETTLRLGVFLGLLAILVAAESLWPRRVRQFPRRSRWPANFGLVVTGALVVRGMSQLGSVLVATGAAVWAQQQHVGLCHWLGLPDLLAVPLCVLLLDALIWAQHRAFHRVPLLWRLHRVHHLDRDFDVSTALRFHPVEIALSMLIKVVAVLILGAPVLAVVLFEVILNAMAMFNHANLRLPAALDRILRQIVVTPDMHRVHHTVYPDEHHRNFGFNLSIWDRLFGTYVAQPRDGHTGTRIGLAEEQGPRPLRLPSLLSLPFRR